MQNFIRTVLVKKLSNLFFFSSFIEFNLYLFYNDYETSAYNLY